MIQTYRTKDAKALIQALFERSNMNEAGALAVVKDIIANVKQRKDAAVFEYALQFDKVQLDAHTVKVTDREFDASYKAVPLPLLEAMRASIANIKQFHEKQKQNTWMDVQDGKMLGQLVRPLASVGIYVPGGKAAYPSSVLMNAIPAIVAGVERVVMVTPCDADGMVYPLTVVAAKEAGITEIYKLGGAQAIAALAFGTQSIPKVDKITGPGNIYVALAKREVFGYCGIDMIAGPSEVLVIADEDANARYVAADMLSQCEHDPLAAAILVTPDEALAQAVQEQLAEQVQALSRKQIALQSLAGHSAIIVTQSMDEAVDIANALAPEHLELLVRDPLDYLGRIKNAGAIFMGEYSPEPLGDYFAGTNHVLPTGGSARFFSPLGVDDFIKKTSVIRYSQADLFEAADYITRFAKAEGLHAHAKSVSIRFES